MLGALELANTNPAGVPALLASYQPGTSRATARTT